MIGMMEIRLNELREKEEWIMSYESLVNRQIEKLTREREAALASQLLNLFFQQRLVTHNSLLLFP